MDNSASSHSILDTLRTVEFRLGLKGYNVDEVDEYLEKAAVEAEQIQERLRGANERLRQATERIAQLEADPRAERPASPPPLGGVPSTATAGPAQPAVADDALQRTLLLAQKFVDQTKRESEAEAAQVVSRAEERARTLLSQAEERARQITTEAEARLRDEVVRLEEMRSRLATEVEGMSRHLEEQRTKIRASLADALRWIDERMQTPGGADEPGAEGRADAAHAGRSPAGAGATPGATKGDVVSANSPGSPAGAGAPRPQTAPAAPTAPERQSAVGVASGSSPERTEAPVGARLGVLNGGLFEAGNDANALGRSRIGD